MKKILTILLVVVMVFSLAGCQNTPEKPVVIQKDMEQMIEQGMVESGDASTPDAAGMDYAELCAYYGVPERYQVNISEGGLTIHGDIAIELPNTKKLPMARVFAAKFPQERVHALFGALCGDTQMYLVPSLWDKAYYEQEVLMYQAQLSIDGADKDFINDRIEELKKQYEAAPETIDLIPSDGTLQTMEVKHDKTDASSGTRTILEATSDPYGADSSMTFTVYNDVDYTDTSVYSYVDEQGNTQVIAPSSGSRLEFQREADLCRYGRDGMELTDVTALSLSGGTAEDCILSTTPQQARETVEQFMAAAGMDGMMIDGVTLYSSKKKELPPELIEQLEQQGRPVKTDEAKPVTQAYVFRLLRQVGGVTVESTHDSSETSIDQVSYGKEWWYEALTIAVDDKGIVNLYWIGPLEVTEVLTENTAILPWSDIESVFEKMIVIQNTAVTESQEGTRIDVTHASLSLQRIMERDSFTSGLLVPVWNFYGTWTSTDEQGNSHVADYGYSPLISINAIDGTVIDVFKGY